VTGSLFELIRIIPKMFHVKQFGKVPAQNLTRQKQGFASGNLRSADICDRLKAWAEACRLRFNPGPQTRVKTKGGRCEP